MKTAILFIASQFLLFSISFASAGNITTDRTAYCKFGKNRIMIFEYTGLPTDSEMLDHIKKNEPFHTSGKMTAAYYFPKGSTLPRAGFNTRCRSIQHTNNLLYEHLDIDQWEFAYMIHFSGKRTFVNCLKTPSNSLCRNQ